MKKKTHEKIQKELCVLKKKKIKDNKGKKSKLVLQVK
jgi:hypothetical protein